MKILFLTRTFYPHIGGVEKHIKEIGLMLIREGHNVTVLTTKYERYLSSYESLKAIKIIRFFQPEIKYLGLLYTWFWILKNRDLFKESDIIHIHDVFIWYLPLKILLPRKKVFVTFHGRWGKYPIPWQDIIQKRIGAKLSDGVICIGKYIAKNYRIKADIITFGATNLSRVKYKKDKKLVVYVGRLDKDIALDTLFEFIKKLKGYRIVFCGDGKLAYKARVYGDVRGFVDPKPFYKKAKYCLASGYLTVMEALASKCLVLVTYDNPLQKDYYELTPFRKFIVYSKDSNELYRKFSYYQRNIDSGREIIAGGYNWVRKQNWREMVDNYYKLWGLKR